MKLRGEGKHSRRSWKERETQFNWHIKVKGLTPSSIKEEDL